MTWKRTVERDLAEMGLGWEGAQRTAPGERNPPRTAGRAPDNWSVIEGFRLRSFSLIDSGFVGCAFHHRGGPKPAAAPEAEYGGSCKEACNLAELKLFWRAHLYRRCDAK
ncbi:hypothetical protein Bbelb_168150 [Branchiostoma belcheri]|nr:hypothetical protein Bbelb_168150 [Branchiostoma belcheri]